MKQTPDCPECKRIDELDFARGVAMLLVIAFHVPLLLDCAGGIELQLPPFLAFVQHEGGVFFILLSGVCATLGSRSLRRGIAVFSCGLLLTAATFLLYLSGADSENILIGWGILSLIGLSMMLYSAFRRLPASALAVLGLLIIFAGYGWREIRVESNMLFFLGLHNMSFSAMDYCPVFPNLGWFMEGVVLGRMLYREKKPLFSGFPSENILMRFFCFIGRNSLTVFMVQYPIIYTAVKIFTYKE